jgi:peptidoglycan/xylan/chitin deacetylase (PgdA/CDA1 family)
MNERTRGIVDSVLTYTPAQPVFHWRASRHLAVVAYHEVRDVERFAAHLDHVQATASPVGLDEVVRAADGRGGLPRHAVLLTFDDGHRDVHDVTLPLLRERGLPAVAFVVAGLLGSDLPPWWTEVKDLVRAGGHARALAGLTPEDAVRGLKRVPDAIRVASLEELRASAARPATPVPQLTAPELAELESLGISIGNHTLTHPCLSRCDDDKIRREIEDAHAIITRCLGHEVDAFAYPDGDNDPRVTAAVRRSGHRVGFLFDHRLSPHRPPDRLRISRVRVDTDATLPRFRIITSGLHPTIHRMRGLG